MDKRTNDSWDISIVKHSKSKDSNTVVRMVEGGPVGRSKSRESNPVVRMVIYANILRINTLSSKSIVSHNLKNIKVTNVLTLCT